MSLQLLCPRANSATEVTYRDLAVDTPSHLSAESLGFRMPEGVPSSDVQKRGNAISEQLVSQFLAADTVVIGAPLYNFTIPTPLKAWIDRIAQAGRIFTYTDKGAVGLAGGKTIIVASTCSGVYSLSAAGNAMEHQESYLKTLFGFLGVTDVRFVRADASRWAMPPKPQPLRRQALQSWWRSGSGKPESVGGVASLTLLF
jgi:FMN-dependent NADH-azoreductase